MDLSAFTQVAQLSSLFRSNDDPVTAEALELLSGHAAKLKAEAVEVFRDAGISEKDRALLMPPSKRALKAAKEAMLLEEDRKDREAKRDFDEKMRTIRLEQEEIATALARASAVAAGATI